MRGPGTRRLHDGATSAAVVGAAGLLLPAAAVDLHGATSDLHRPATPPSHLRRARPCTALCRAAATTPLPCPAASGDARISAPACTRAGGYGLRLVAPVQSLDGNVRPRHER